MNTKIVLIIAGIIALVVITLLVSSPFPQSVDDQGQVNEQQQEVSQVREDIGDLLADNDYENARNFLEQNKDVLTDSQYNLQKNRIDTIESYDDFYTQGDRAPMIAQVKRSIDDRFAVVASAESSNAEKAGALNAVAFLYSETWSDPELATYVAEKLGLEAIDSTNDTQVIRVFTELFDRSIAFFPTQDAQVKRAWFNSRYLAVNKEATDTERQNILTAIQQDIELSGATKGLRAEGTSNYYYSFTNLAYADVLDLLYREGKIDDYGLVEEAYVRALTVAQRDFFGNLIPQDIIRMNYAASLARVSEIDNQEKIRETLLPVAENIRSYTGKMDLAYEGILIMLRTVPVAQNHNNSLIHFIFSTYEEYADIPPLLGWDSVTDSEHIFKII